jgi:phosphosulfolactate phosphohydrolase-like enzyme
LLTVLLDRPAHGVEPCASGRELAALGRVAEVRLAAEHDVSTVVPRLAGGAFAQLSWPG